MHTVRYSDIAAFAGLPMVNLHHLVHLCQKQFQNDRQPKF